MGNMASNDKAKTEREQRLATALRENLRKRKAQARDLRDSEPGDGAEDDR